MFLLIPAQSSYLTRKLKNESLIFNCHEGAKALNFRVTPGSFLLSLNAASKIYKAKDPGWT